MIPIGDSDLRNGNFSGLYTLPTFLQNKDIFESNSKEEREKTVRERVWKGGNSRKSYVLLITV